MGKLRCSDRWVVLVVVILSLLSPSVVVDVMRCERWR
jgi:hypothetical protein